MDLKNCAFHCPYCKVHLSNTGEIVLSSKGPGDIKGTIYLSIAVGDYKFRHDPPVEFKKGEVVDFYCPSCGEDLSSDHYENFGRLLMRVSNNVEFELLFSREAGKRKTYVITEDGMESYSGR